MKTIRKACLRLTQGRSDKVYEVDLCELTSTRGDKRYLVNYRYGRYGKTLRESSKTVLPVTLEEATQIFDSMVVSKLNQGYVNPANPNPYQNTGIQSTETQSSMNADTPLSQAKAKILFYLDNPPSHWSLSRIIWRAGELKITEASAKIAKLAKAELEKAPFKKSLNPFTRKRGDDKKEQKILHYALVWSLGRCGDESHIPIIREFYKGGHQNVRDLAGLVLYHLSRGDERLFLTDNIINRLDDVLAHEVQTQDADKIYKYFKNALKQNRKKNTTKLMHDLLRVYQLSVSMPSCQKAVMRLASDKKLKSEHFVTIRQLFKFSEFLQDAQTYARLNMLIENMYSGWYEEFSPKTLVYLRKRCWRTLRKMGQVSDDGYIDFASAILLSMTDAHAQEPITVEKVERDWYSREVTYINYGRFPKNIAFNQILFRHSEQFQCGKDGLSWQIVGESDTQRVEAFPELWDKHPKALLLLLQRSRCLEVHEFATKALIENTDFCQQIDVDALITLLSTDYVTTAEFALTLVRQAYHNTEQTDVMMQIISACMRSIYQPAKSQAITWLREKPQLLTADLALFAIVLCHSIDFPLDGIQLVAEQQTQLLDGVAKELSLIVKNSNQSSVKKIHHIVTQLTKVAPQALANYPLDSIDNLLSQQHDDLKLFGALLLVHHDVQMADIPEAMLAKITESDNIDINSVQVRLLAKYTDAQLIEQYDLICHYLLSKHAQVRQAIVDIVKRLATQATPESHTFAQRLLNDLIPHFFKAEAYDGLHADLHAIIENHLMPVLADIDHQLRWRLLQAKSKTAQKLGVLALSQIAPSSEATKIYSVKQWASLGANPNLAVRQWSQQSYQAHIEHIKTHKDSALRLLNSKWDDSRQFAIDYFRQHFTAEDWHSDLIIGICDSVYDDVQRFGRELINTFFEVGDGVNYLTKLSQHPSQNVQLFTTNYLADYATGDIERLKKLQNYFITVLSQVCRGRVAKDRIIYFLNKEALQNKANARFVIDIYSRQAVTLSIMDRVSYIEGLHALKLKFPDINMPMTVQTLPIKGKYRSLSHSGDSNNNTQNTQEVSA